MFLSVTEALKIVDASRPTICKWCENGEVKAEKIKDNSRRGFHWKIDKADLLRKAIEIESRKKGIKKETSEVKQQTVDTEEKGGDGESEYSGEKVLIAEMSRQKKIPRVEAERLLKVEQAIERQTKNMIALGKLIRVEEVNESVEQAFSTCWELLRELLDKWNIEYALGQELTARMHSDFNRCLQKSHRKLLEKLDASENSRSLQEELTNTGV